MTYITSTTSRGFCEIHDLITTKASRHSPVLHEVVLQRVPGEHHPPLRPDGLEGLRDGGVRVLDPMALVADDEVRAGVDQRPLDHWKERDRIGK